MTNGEAVLNLWYVHDEQGIIYSLRARAYVADGSDEAKLAFLQSRAMLDYIIAEPFEIPPQFHLRIGAGRDAKKMPVAHVKMLNSADTPLALFEQAIRTLESRFPAQSHVCIPQNPLFCTTPLIQNKQGVIEPRCSGQIRY